MSQTVVIVDDHAGFRGFARRLLEADGFTVVGEAENGASAVAAVEELRPELVLLDIVLPDMDGFSVAERLVENGDGPVVVLTSSREAADFGERLELSPARVYNFVGMNKQLIVASEDLPTGENLILGASFDKTGEDPPGVANGTLTLYHADKKVGEAQIKTQPGKFTIGGEGLCVGRDGGSGVTLDYPGVEPWAFTGGTILRVAVDVSGEPYIDLEREAAAMLMRE